MRVAAAVVVCEASARGRVGPIPQTYWWSRPVRLTRRQKRFIRENCDRLSVTGMARRLKIPVAEVRRGLRQMGLVSADTPAGSGQGTAALGLSRTGRLIARLAVLKR